MDDGTYGNIMIIMYFSFSLLALTQKQRRRGEKETQKKKKKKNKAPPPSSQPTSNTTSDHGRKSTPKIPKFRSSNLGRIPFQQSISPSRTYAFCIETTHQKKQNKKRCLLSWFVLGFRSLCVCIGVGRNAKQSKAKQSKANQSNACVVDKGAGGCSRREAQGAERESEEEQETEQKSKLGFVGFRVSLGM